MSVSMALMSSLSAPNLQCMSYQPHPQTFPKTHFSFPALTPKRAAFDGVCAPHAVADGGSPVAVEVKEEADKEGNGSPPVVAAVKEGGEGELVQVVKKFEDGRWVGGTWDLKQFKKDEKVDWDAVIDAEVRRRKWLEINPETSSNDDPVLFDTSIIPWWAWMKRFHLPEAELLNGRAAMVGFFMAYFVDSLTGVGLVDQMGNFFCKTLLFVAVAGVLLVRKNEDIETLKKLIDETNFYDKQWQATWQDETKKE
ncbi:hypothetical protein MLD38_036502 [Melastoma candidum]|uniref:Uncharacterized protein n=1 Tax=Melastoma candidum TaxID=119954 RepID=A0ACB9LJE4_9MYRT|nr:hypothetical protein MLD38_036502 [Melastoma candidum]